MLKVMDGGKDRKGKGERKGEGKGLRFSGCGELMGRI